jgi:hypothetical protein
MTDSTLSNCFSRHFRPILLALLVLVAAGCIERDAEHIPFNREDWINGDWRTRGKMVDHLIRDSLLIGKTSEEVEQLLGEQDEECESLSFPVDIGLRTGPLGIGGTWLFSLNVIVDTTSCRVIDVRCTD